MSDELGLPYSEEAERGTLGSIILSPLMCLPLARERMGLTTDSFLVPECRDVFAALCRMDDAGKSVRVDLLTLGEELERAGRFGLIGGSSFLEGLIDATPSAANGEYYMDIVRQKAVLRNVISVSDGIKRDAYRCGDADELLQTASGAYLDISAGLPEDEETNEEVLDRVCAKFTGAAGGDDPDWLSMPWPSVDDLLCGLEVGLTVLAGRPSHGKTTLEDMICVHLARTGVGSGRITLDGSRDELLTRAACRVSGVSLPKLKGGFARKDQLAEFVDAAEVLKPLPMWFDDTTRSLRGICAKAREWKRKYDIGLLTVDFLQLVQVIDPDRRSYSRVDLVGEVSGGLKALSFDLGIPVLALSQLSRGVEKEGREPQLSDLRDSGNIEQDAHKVIFVYKDTKVCKEMEEAHAGATKKVRPSWVDVLKNKDGETGRVPFLFRAPYFLFEEAVAPFGELIMAEGGIL